MAWFQGFLLFYQQLKGKLDERSGVYFKTDMLTNSLPLNLGNINIGTINLPIQSSKLSHVHMVLDFYNKNVLIIYIHRHKM